MLADSLPIFGLTNVKDCSVRTLADDFHPALSRRKRGFKVRQWFLLFCNIGERVCSRALPKDSSDISRSKGQEVDLLKSKTGAGLEKSLGPFAFSEERWLGLN